MAIDTLAKKNYQLLNEGTGLKAVLVSLSMALLFGFGLIVSSTTFAATSLSDNELAGISGAGAEPVTDEPLIGEQGLLQEPQQPSNNSSGFTPSQPFQINDGMELAPEIFTILQSSATVQRDRNLVLSGVTQMNAKAVNLENLLSSDFIAANNIFSGGGLTLDDVTSEIEVNQLNSLSQIHRVQGSLNSSVAGYSYETTSHINSGTEKYDQRNFFSIDQHDRLTTLSMDERDWRVSVDKVNFSQQFLVENKIITFLQPVTFTLIAGGKIGDIVEGFFGDEYGIEASYTGLFLEGPSASFNDIEPYGPNGDDMLIDTTARLGLIDFGIFKATACFIGCAPEAKVDLGELEILNLFEFLATVDPGIASTYGVSFSSDGIILEGMGSAFDDELNLNTGFAVLGNGYLKVTDPASIKVGGEFNLGVDAGITFSLDLSSIDLGLFGPWPKDWSWPASDKNNNNPNILDMVVRFTLLNIEGEIFNEPFDGEFIARLGPGDVTASSNIDNNPPVTEHDSLTIFDMDVVDISESSFAEFYQHTTFIGGQMTGAEAELLALSEGNLTVNNDSTVSLAQSAQQNMRVFNGVNAVSSIAANALNISQLPVVTGGLSTVSRTSMQQHNLIVQQR